MREALMKYTCTWATSPIQLATVFLRVLVGPGDDIEQMWDEIQSPKHRGEWGVSHVGWGTVLSQVHEGPLVHRTVLPISATDQRP